MSILDIFLNRSKNVKDSIKGIESKSVPTTSESIRVNPELLERIYRRDPVIFNGVNLYIKTILSTDFRFESDSESVVKYMKRWSELVNLREVIMRSVSDMCIFGNAWFEIIINKGRDTVARLDYLDPKLMDFRRNHMQKIIFDRKTKLPKSYVQYLPPDAPQQPNEITQNSIFGDFNRAIELDREIIFHAPLFTIGNDLLGVGLIESLYDDSSNKRVIEKGAGQYIFRLGYPIIVGYVGNENQYPIPDANVIREVSNKITNLTERSTIALPHYVKLELLESKRGEKYQAYLSHYISQQVTGLGIPLALATGSGEETNRSTLQSQMLMFERTLRFFQYRISTALEEQVFSKISLMQNWNEIPKIVWDEISLESLESKARRITDYVKAGVLTPDEEVEKFIRIAEGIPPKKE